MAHMTQEKKAVIAAKLKEVMPKGWKYTMRVERQSTLRLVITSAPVNLLDCVEAGEPGPDGYKQSALGCGYYTVNHHRLRNEFSGEMLDTFTAVLQAMNTGNWDRSDIQTDYFDVGHYVAICIGEWGRPFKVAPVAENKSGEGK